ncbi:MAG: hypothetical protein ACF8R7_16225, partial [Phycisphaerales bacterium JB039]
PRERQGPEGRGEGERTSRERSSLSHAPWERQGPEGRGEGERTFRERSERSTLSLSESLSSLASASAATTDPLDTPRATSPEALFTTTLTTLAEAGPDNPEALAPIRAHCARALREESLEAFNATHHAALLRAAAGASLIARSAIHDRGPWRAQQFAFQPAASAHGAAPAPFTIQLAAINCGYATPDWRLAAIDLIAPEADPEPDDDDDEADALEDAQLDAELDAELDGDPADLELDCSEAELAAFAALAASPRARSP